METNRKVYRHVIIYGGGFLGAMFARNVQLSGGHVSFIWDMRAQQDVPARSFAPVKYPVFMDGKAENVDSDATIVICSENADERNLVRENLKKAGLEPEQEFSSSADIIKVFDKEKAVIAAKETSWLSDIAAGRYQENTEERGWSREIIMPKYLKHIPTGSSVLDVGCGQGRLTVALYEHGCKTTGLDISFSQLQRIKAQFPEITWVEGNALQMPFENNAFDAVTSLWFLQHFPNWKEFLAEQVRVVKPGGTIIFDTQFREHESIAEAVTGKRCRPQSSSQDGTRVVDEIGDLPEGDYNFRASTTVRELEEFCNAENLCIAALLPHSLFVGNAFVEGNMDEDEQRSLRKLLWSYPEANYPLIEAMAVYEEMFITKMPYWFARHCIVVLNKQQ